MKQKLKKEVIEKEEGRKIMITVYNSLNNNNYIIKETLWVSFLSGVGLSIELMLRLWL